MQGRRAPQPHGDPNGYAKLYHPVNCEKAEGELGIRHLTLLLSLQRRYCPQAYALCETHDSPFMHGERVP